MTSKNWHTSLFILELKREENDCCMDQITYKSIWLLGNINILLMSNQDQLEQE